MKQKKGFTIIEVVLVLAIGGLIFLMVFIALPALQRSQRNTQRREDVDRLYAAMIEYQKHNKGRLPFHNTQFDINFATRYIDSSCSYAGNHSEYVAQYGSATYINCGEGFTDPDGSPYIIGLAYGGTQSQFLDDSHKWGEIHAIYIATDTKCGASEDAIVRAKGKNNFVVAMHLEGGSIYCKDNS